MAEYADPVKNPMGALQQMQQQQQEGWQQRQAQLQKIQGMTEKDEEADANERWAAMAQAAAKSSPMVGGFGQMIANIGGAYGQTLAAQRQTDLKNQQAILEAMGKGGGGGLGAGSMTAMTKAALDPFIRTKDGIFRRDTAEMVVPSNLMPEFNKLYEQRLKMATDQEMENPTEWAYSGAMQDMQRVMSNPSIAGGRTTGGFTPPGQASAKPMGAPTGAPTSSAGTTAPTQEAAPNLGFPAGTEVPKVASNAQATNERLAIMQQERDDIASQPEYEGKAGDLAALDREIQRLAGQQQSATKFKTAEKVALAKEDYATAKNALDMRQRVEAGPGPLIYKDKAAAKGREKTAEVDAEKYTKLFHKDVVEPASAFSDAGKVMEDFNNLSKMNEALQGGKFKEYMSGEAGKWVLSVADPNSDLAKGISNAQQAAGLSQSMAKKLIDASAGTQTEGDRESVLKQVVNIGKSEDANKYIEAYTKELGRQLNMRKDMGSAHAEKTGSYKDYDKAWRDSPIMSAKGSVKKFGKSWLGLSQFMDKAREKNPSFSDERIVAEWNKIK